MFKKAKRSHFKIKIRSSWTGWYKPGAFIRGNTVLGRPIYLSADYVSLGFFFLSFFRHLPSKLAKRNSRKIDHMLGSKWNLKMHALWSSSGFKLDTNSYPLYVNSAFYILYCQALQTEISKQNSTKLCQKVDGNSALSMSAAQIWSPKRC